MLTRLSILLELLNDEIVYNSLLSEEIIRRGNYFFVVPKPKIAYKGGKKKKIYKKKKHGGLYTLGKFKIHKPSSKKSVENARKRAKARLRVVETYKRKKGGK